MVVRLPPQRILIDKTFGVYIVPLEGRPYIAHCRDGHEQYSQKRKITTEATTWAYFFLQFSYSLLLHKDIYHETNMFAFDVLESVWNTRKQYDTNIQWVIFGLEHSSNLTCIIQICTCNLRPSCYSQGSDSKAQFLIEWVHSPYCAPNLLQCTFTDVTSNMNYERNSQ